MNMYLFNPFTRINERAIRLLFAEKVEQKIVIMLAWCILYNYIQLYKRILGALHLSSSNNIFFSRQNLSI